MRYIDLRGSNGPTDLGGVLDVAWLNAAQKLQQNLIASRDKATRDAIVDSRAAKKLWGELRLWLLRLSHDKCWYSEARDLFSVLEIEHYRPKKRCKRSVRGELCDGYWWLAFDWSNYRLCGKIGNAKKGDLFPLAEGSPVSTYNGLSELNEIPLLLDPACPGDPDLLSFNEDGAATPHADADCFTRLRVKTTIEHVNLNHGRIRKGRQRVWAQCWRLIEDSRDLACNLDRAPGPADRERLNLKKEELRRMVQPEAEFSAVARDCLLKSNISWVHRLAAG